MTRILKSLGLAVAAVAALVAVMAPAAHAETGALTPFGGPTIITGVQGPGPVFDIGPGPTRTVECTTSDLDSTILGPADPVTFKPTYENCRSEPGFRPTTVTTNGCDYRIGFGRPGTTGQPPTTGTLQASIVCPPGQQLEVHVYENAARHAENISMCTYDVPAQGPIPAGVYHNVPGPPADVQLTLNANFFALNTMGPAFICGGMAFQNIPFTLTGDYTLRGFADQNGEEGPPIPIHVF
jgi:hypothetical protein